MMKATAKMSRKISVEIAEAELKLPPCMSEMTSWLSTAVGEFAEELIMMTGRSYMRSASRVRNRMATISAGLISGRVIFVNCCQRDAPSTRAAS